MQFIVMMRDGSRFRIEAAYIEVVNAEESSYTFLGPVPGYSSAILATFPAALVVAVLPLNQIDGYRPAGSQNGNATAGRPPAAVNGGAPAVPTGGAQAADRSPSLASADT